ncbi:hypothetical protein BQ9231_00230 [Cedratvirus lausannensis]|uniref:Uncharacterized protein n=1 Tax=Cedratvirus lausannensis TaxID=2023205 RepID=A0A285PWS5_9VIRU|nr:hypothetical protein BQ9231_00230 [Cedratvirus lausannensis]
MLEPSNKLLDDSNSEVLFFAGYWIIFLPDYVREDYDVWKAKYHTEE